MWVVIILFMCRHCDTVICSPMLCEWLLYWSYVVTVIQLYVAQCYVSGYYIVRVVTVIQLYVAQYYVSGYYIVHVSSLWYSYM